MNSKLLNIIKLILGWPLSAVAIIFIVKFILNNSSKINITPSNINPVSLVISFVLFGLYFIFRSITWKKIIEYHGFKVSFKDNLYLWEFSEIKRYVPGNVWSFLSRASLFSEKKIDKKTIFISLLTESQLIVISSSIISIFSIYFVAEQFKLPSIFSYGFIFLVLVALIIFLWGHKLKTKYLSKFLPAFGIEKNLILILLSVFSFLLYGIASYFAASSLFDLRNLSPVILIAFFNFAFLVGYVSFITPMGLGVREGIVTVGLSAVLGLVAAGALAIYTRIVFVIAEVIFIMLVAIFTRGEELKNFILRHKYEIVLLAFVLIYNIYFNTASFLRYDNYYTGRFDLGNMAQTVWNTSHGKIFELTDPNGTQELSRLAYHADFILILLTPFYIIWSDPKVLLLIQTVVLSMGAIFVYLISKELLKNKFASTILGICFLFYPAIQYVNLFDFHGVALATTFILAAFYYLLKKRYFIFIVFLILAGLTKEEIWLINALFGIYVMIFYRKYILGALMFLISTFLFYYLIWHAIPQALGSQHFALAYYSDFGSTPSSVVKNIIFSPVETLSKLLGKEQLDYIKQLFLPLGYFSFLSPIFLIFAAPDLLIDLLSSNPQLHQIYYQYSSSITPFIFISAIYSIKLIHSKLKEVSIEILAVILLIFTLLTSFSYGPLPFDHVPSLDMFIYPQKNRAVIDSYLSSIPGNASISSTNNLGSHLSERENIYTVPMGIGQADYVLYLLNDSDSPQYDEEKTSAAQMLSNPKYKLDFQQDNFLVFKKNN